MSAYALGTSIHAGLPTATPGDPVPASEKPEQNEFPVLATGLARDERNTFDARAEAYNFVPWLLQDRLRPVLEHVLVFGGELIRQRSVDQAMVEG